MVAQIAWRNSFPRRGGAAPKILRQMIADRRCSGKIEWPNRMRRLKLWDCDSLMAALSTLTAPSDEQLVVRSAAGDRSALEELFRRYRQVAYRVAYRLLSNEADALDAVQNGFVKALVHLP